jgi:hypothetical protein
MKIHELTQHTISRTDEGFMDTLKSIKNTPYGQAIDQIGQSALAAKQAVGQTVQNVSNRIPTPVKRVAGAVGTGVGRAVSGAASAIANPTATMNTLKTAYKNPMTAVKAAVSGTSGLSFQQKMAGVQTTQAVQQLAKKFQQAWQNYSVQWAKSQGGVYTAPGRAKPPAQATAAQATAPKAAAPTPATAPQYRNNTVTVIEGITPDTLLPGYEDALKAFVQKNMLSGMQYSRLQNVAQIDQIIGAIVDPQNDTPAAQNKLWNQLALASSVAQKTPGDYNPAAAPPAGQTRQTGQPTQQPPAAVNDINAIMAGIGVTINPRQLKMLGQAMQQDSGITEIHSNGDPLLDALLKMMGYRVT